MYACQHLKKAFEYTLNHVVLCATSKQFAFRGFVRFPGTKSGSDLGNMTKTTENSSLERPQHGAKSSPNRRQIEPKIASPRGQIEPQNGSKSSPKWGPQEVREGSWEIIGFCPLFSPPSCPSCGRLGGVLGPLGGGLGVPFGLLEGCLFGSSFRARFGMCQGSDLGSNLGPKSAPRWPRGGSRN